MAAHQDQDFMRHSIKVMRDAGIGNKSGGPFGAPQHDFLGGPALFLLTA